MKRAAQTASKEMIEMKKFDVKKLFYNNRFVAVFSVVLAIIFWLVINLAVNPADERVFSNIPVKIDTTGTAASAVNLEVITQSVQTVNVTVRGERFALYRLSDSDIEAYASTINVNARGVYNLPISARLVNDSDNTSLSFSVSIDTTTVRFDQKETRTFPVHPYIENVSAGEGRYLGELSVIDNSTVMIYGPITELNTIEEVRAVYSPDTPEVLSETIYPSAQIKLYDENGAEIISDLLEISPSNTCYITIPVMMNKTVGLGVRYADAPSTQFSLPATLSQNEIEITGPANVVSEIDYLNLASISTKNISVSHNTFERHVNIDRTGVSLTDKSSGPVTVTFDMTGYSEKNFSVPIAGHHVVTGLNEQFSYEITTTNSVTMVGPTAVIEAMNAGDLYYEIDLSDIISPGTYERNVTVKMLNNTSVWAYGNYRCTINITQAP